MYKAILSLILLSLFVSCNHFSGPGNGDAGFPKLNIYYFHATNRCGNCMAIEENTLKALETYFPKELKSGAIRFQSVNIDQDTNKVLVDRCDASAMNLIFVVTEKNGKERKTDYSEFAINTARSKPDSYMRGIRDRIQEELQ